MRVTELLIFLVGLACAQCRTPSDYLVNKADGKMYRLVYNAKPWAVAARLCQEEGAKLAVPKTTEEFQFLQSVVRGMHYPSVQGTDYKLLVWLGVNNLENYRIWKNVDGEDINATGFHDWASGNGDTIDNLAEPRCVGMDAANHGLRQYWCKNNQPYICQK